MAALVKENASCTGWFPRLCGIYAEKRCQASTLYNTLLCFFASEYFPLCVFITLLLPGLELLVRFGWRRLFCLFGLLLFCPSVSKRCSRSGKTEPRARFQPRHGFIMRKQPAFLQHPPLIQASVADAVRFSNVYVTMCLVSKMRQMGSAVLKTSDFLTHGLVNHSAGALWMHDQYFKHTLPLQGRCSLLSNNIWRLYAWLLPSSNSYKTIISFNEKLVSAGVWATVAEASLLQLLLASTWRF